MRPVAPAKRSSSRAHLVHMPTRFTLILTGLHALLRYSAWRHASFRGRLAERTLIAQ